MPSDAMSPPAMPCTDRCRQALQCCKGIAVTMHIVCSHQTGQLRHARCVLSVPACERHPGHRAWALRQPDQPLNHCIHSDVNALIRYYVIGDCTDIVQAFRLPFGHWRNFIAETPPSPLRACASVLSTKP